jgi:hypothetical protein
LAEARGSQPVLVDVRLLLLEKKTGISFRSRLHPASWANVCEVMQEWTPIGRGRPEVNDDGGPSSAEPEIRTPLSLRPPPAWAQLFENLAVPPLFPSWVESPRVVGAMVVCHVSKENQGEFLLMLDSLIAATNREYERAFLGSDET